jgi:hypothetical protein
MNPFVLYCLHQVGRGYGDSSIVRFFCCIHLQRGHGIGGILRGFWQWIKLIIWKGAKSLGCETMRTGCKIFPTYHVTHHLTCNS